MRMGLYLQEHVMLLKDILPNIFLVANFLVELAPSKDLSPTIDDISEAGDGLSFPEFLNLNCFFIKKC